MINKERWEHSSANTTLTDDNVHIWRLLFSSNSEPVSSNTLSDDEIQKAERFRFEADKNKYVLSRTVLRNLLSQYTGIDARELTFSYTRYGKPSLLNQTRDTPVCFNLTHSKDIALFAFAQRCEIGIDIEYMRNNVEYLKLAERFFSRQEYQALAKLSDSELKMGFYRCWTRKEAFIKALGTSLSSSHSKFAVNVEKDGDPRLIWADKKLFHGTCNMFPVTQTGNYFATLACLCDIKHVELFDCE